jgi:hypothetical protein
MFRKPTQWLLIGDVPGPTQLAEMIYQVPVSLYLTGIDFLPSGELIER